MKAEWGVAQGECAVASHYGHVYEIEFAPQSAPYMPPLPEGPLRIAAANLEEALVLTRFFQREVTGAKKILEGVQW